ncbi:hypothetical protein [Nevskia soli]|uniref:hypothetical protein n=1 Tax=Nevskia soli TaxID=418856 RepID=UPI0012F9F9F2|nr:hypothetical protein [Nevskia soli]
MNRLIFLAFVAALAPQAAFAADAAPPAPDCTRPNLNATKMTRDTGVHDTGAEAQAYLQCLKDYTTAQKVVQQQYVDAINKAINDYNSFVKDFNEYQQQQQQK